MPERISLWKGEVRYCVYNATRLASAMKINKFISAALGLGAFVLIGFRFYKDVSKH